MARSIAGVGSSHVPAIGAALDNGKTEEPHWKRVFSGFEKSKEWMAKTKPDVAIVVYNDHASAFSVEMIPTFALGCAAEFPPADEGWGPRPVPVLKGHPELAAHIEALDRRVRPSAPPPAPSKWTLRVSARQLELMGKVIDLTGRGSTSLVIARLGGARTEEIVDQRIAGPGIKGDELGLRVDEGDVGDAMAER